MLYTFSEIQNAFAPLNITVQAHGGGVDFYRAAGDYVYIGTPSLPATIDALKELVSVQFANADTYLASQNQ